MTNVAGAKAFCLSYLISCAVPTNSTRNHFPSTENASSTFPASPPHTP
jgi:hypothetical protein